MHHNHTDQAVGTVLGTVLGFVEAWDANQFTHELETIKLAAIGAVTGFVVTYLLKLVVKGVKILLSKLFKN